MENWIVYNKEYADLQQIAEHFKLNLKELQKNLERYVIKQWKKTIKRK